MTLVKGCEAVLEAPRTLTFKAFELDLEHLGPSEVFAVTEYSTVSLGTERAAYVGLPPLRPGPIYPRLVGYCNAARVVAVGPDVRDLLPGTRILTHQSHRSSFVCNAKDVLTVIPDHVDACEASATYIAHIALTALQRAEFVEGETLVVQGLGPIGLAAISLASAVPGATVVGVGNDPGRMELARSLGCSTVVDGRLDDVATAIATATKGQGADVVVTTLNSWHAWRTTLSSVRRFGRIAVLGFPGRGEPAADFNPLEAADFYGRQPVIISAGQAAGPGAWGSGDAALQLRSNMHALLKQVATSKLELNRLQTHIFDWSELGEVYARAELGDKAMISPVLTWDTFE